MRLSNQHKQILLVLLRNNPYPLELSRILRPVLEFKRKKWSSSTDKDTFPRTRVISASFCRSLKTLRARGLVTKAPKLELNGTSSLPPRAWRLTTKGLAEARRIKLELKGCIKKLKRRIEELNELLYKP